MQTQRRIQYLMIVAAYPPHKNAGMERGCQRLAEALCRRGHRVTVLTQAWPSLPEWSTRRLGSRSTLREESWSGELTLARVLRPVPIGPLWGLSFMAQVSRWMKRLRGRWDFCLCHKLHLHAAAAGPTARRLGKPCATLLVNAGEFSDLRVLREHRRGDYLTKLALRQDGFFALSGQSACELQDAGVAPERVLPYRYFIDGDRFSPAPEEQPSGPRPFVYMGRFHEQKNLPMLIEAFGALHGKHPAARLRLVGDGPEAESVRRLVAQSSAASAITIIPWTDDPVAEYRRALAVVTASHAEGLSNVLLEAMACGAPVITTDVSGAPDVLLDGPAPATFGESGVLEGRGGLLLRRGDAPALVRAMEQLLLSDGQRARLAGEARSRAVEGYTEGPAVELFLRGVETLLAIRRESARQ